MKKVLVVYYSQTGQLERILRSMMAPLESSPDVEITWERLAPQVPYPFPWPVITFFDQFPECVRLDPPDLLPTRFDKNEDYDLVVLGYQPWYLSPSPPTSAFLKSPDASILKDRPVVTVVGCRNMWLMGQEAVRTMIRAVGGRLVGNVVLVDAGSPGETFITTPLWLLSGRKDVLPGVLTPAGVSDVDIAASSRYGDELLLALSRGLPNTGESVLDGRESAPVNRKYLLSEMIGRWAFGWGAPLIRLAGRQGSWARIPLLGIFALLLGAGIVTIVPITLLLLLVLSFSPGYKRWLEQQAQYHESGVRALPLSRPETQ